MDTSVTTKMEWLDPQAAFTAAIKSGLLTDDQVSHPTRAYAGDYMYMGTINGRDQFKHIDTRAYLEPLTPWFRA